jgi:1-deoxy-D-xylulose-5-phosphate reductoisomerase
LQLAYRAQETGGSATCTLNAADEVAVEAFLEGRIGFPAIAEAVEETLSKVPVRHPATIDDILEIDRESRSVCRDVVTSRSSLRKDAIPARV